MAMDDDMTPWCLECQCYHDHARMLRIAVQRAERRQRLQLQLDAIACEARRVKEFTVNYRNLDHLYNHAVNILSGVLLVEGELKEE